MCLDSGIPSNYWGCCDGVRLFPYGMEHCQKVVSCPADDLNLSFRERNPKK